MKGLLLKDWYAINAYCRAYIILIVTFSIAGGVMEENILFTYYPCIFAGVIAMSLLAYEEKEKWEQYAATLPYTKAQMVSSKYIVSLCFGVVTILLNIIAQLIRMIFLNSFAIERLLSMLLAFIPLTLASTAFLLPFIYKFGANKGRIAYYILFAVFGGAIGVLASNQTIGLLDKVSVPQTSVSIIVFVVSLAVYVFSWALSIHFYKNREF
ncbi:MAG: ABC-2 transporter permease [Roseburia sp.]|nr:ABC-2 transporter permease [Roseburia sp.]